MEMRKEVTGKYYFVLKDLYETFEERNTYKNIYLILSRNKASRAVSSIIRKKYLDKVANGIYIRKPSFNPGYQDAVELHKLANATSVKYLGGLQKKPKAQTTSESGLSVYSENELLEELKKRGYSGKIEKRITFEI
jgi:hypothetical protein